MSWATAMRATRREPYTTTQSVVRFGDNTLTQKFVWKKKNEYLQAAGGQGPSGQ